MMESAAGRPLQEQLDAPRTARQAIELAGRIGQVLDRAHRHGLVHRNLTPTNIILAEQQVSLVNFASTHGDGDNMALGGPPANRDPLYQAPEQLRGEAGEIPADLYSFATILYRLLTGRLPYEEADEATVAASVLILRKIKSPPAPPSLYRPELPAQIDAVLLRALSPDATRRYPTAAALIRAAEAALVAPASEMPTVRLDPSLASPTGKPGQLPVLMTGGIILVLLIGASVFGFVRLRSNAATGSNELRATATTNRNSGGFVPGPTATDRVTFRPTATLASFPTATLSASRTPTRAATTPPATATSVPLSLGTVVNVPDSNSVPTVTATRTTTPVPTATTVPTATRPPNTPTPTVRPPTATPIPPTRTATAASTVPPTTAPAAGGASSVAVRSIQDMPGTASGVYLNLTNPGDHAEVAPAQVMPAASLIKLPIAGAIYQQVAAGKMQLTDTFTLRQADKVGGTGILQGQPAGTTYTLDELVEIVLVNSDNTGANMLVDRLGGFGAVNEFSAAQGMPNTVMRRRLFDLQAQANGIDNTTSAADIANYFARLHRGQLVNATVSTRLKEILLERGRQDRNWALLNIPASVPAAHMTGTNTRIRNDAILVTKGNQTYLLVILSKDGEDAALEQGIARASATIYGAVGGP